MGPEIPRYTPEDIHNLPEKWYADSDLVEKFFTALSNGEIPQAELEKVCEALDKNFNIAKLHQYEGEERLMQEVIQRLKEPRRKAMEQKKNGIEIIEHDDTNF